MQKVTLIKGDGIGPEVINATIRIIKELNVDIEWEEMIAGEEAIKRGADPLPDITLENIKKNRLALKGPLTTPIGSGYRSVNVRLRQELDLYAGVRPAKSLPISKYKNVDLVIIRENTEDLYTGIEEAVSEERTEAKRVITRNCCHRIIDFAFLYAKKEKRKKITIVHKANILKLTCGMFLSVAKEVAKNYPDIEFEDKLIDNMAMQLVMKPQNYDVIVCTNLFGDILSDEAAGLVGGLGVVASANIGRDCAIFEPVHGSCPKYANLNIANPIAAILTGVMLLKYINKLQEAEKLEKAINKTLMEKKYLTPDMGGSATTSQLTDAIIDNLNLT